MKNDYECPNCHNIFPSQNKIMHDIRCSKENPMPLDQSRQINKKIIYNNILKKEKKEKNNRNKIPKKIPSQNISLNIPDFNPPSDNLLDYEDFEDIFTCDLCGATMLNSEKKDHMFCHNLQNEENLKANGQNNLGFNQRQIQEQKKIEKMIKQKNERLRQAQIRQNRRQNQIQQGQHRFPRLDNIFMNPNNFNINNNSVNNQNISINLNSNNQRPSLIRIRRTANNQQNNHYLTRNRMSDILNHFFNNVVNRDHPTDQQFLNALPETIIDDINKLDNEKRNCVICLEEFKNGDKATSLPCIHLFHTSCIKNWLKKQNSCPICKFKITQENMNP